MKRRILALGLSLLFLTAIFAGCGKSLSGTQPSSSPGASTGNTETSGDYIMIGTIQPITGPVSVYGVQTRNAVEMAIEEINTAGGVLGKQLKLVVADDEANPEKTVTAFKRQATQDKIVALVGALTSKCSLAITKEANDRKIIMCSPSSTNDAVTSKDLKYIFRACYNDSFQGQVVAKFALDNLKGKNAAILYDNTNDYSKGLRDNFKAKFEEMGGTIVAEESYATGDQDFSAQITTIKGKNPDVIFVPDYYSTVSLIAKQVRNQGIDKPMLGADGWDEIANNAGDEVVGCYYSNHYSPDADDAEVKSFVEKYKAKYKGEIPNALAALGYDSTYIIADAIKAAGSTDPDAIADAMMKTNKKFVTGQISFNETHNPVKSAVMVKLEAGAEPNKPKVVYSATVNP